MLRERRLESNAKVRQAMRTGDDRYLPARDKGPVKRFLRDYVDARLSVAEFLLPLLLVIMVVLQYTPNDTAVQVGLYLWQALLLVIVVDTGWLIFRSKRALRAQFPEESLKGTTLLHGAARDADALPAPAKPQVRLGGAPRGDAVRAAQPSASDIGP